MSETKLKVLAKYRNRIEAEQAVTILLDAGIDAMVQADDVGGMYAGLSLSGGGARILVREEDEDEARRVLEHGGPADDDDGGVEVETGV